MKGIRQATASARFSSFSIAMNRIASHSAVRASTSQSTQLHTLLNCSSRVEAVSAKTPKNSVSAEALSLEV